MFYWSVRLLYKLYCHLRLLHLWLASRLWLYVRGHEELGKENEQGKNVNDIRDNNAQTGFRTLCGQKVAALRHHGHKLNQLHGRQARLPPNGQRLARFWNLCVHAND